MNIAHVCTPHGFGHLTRQIAIATSLMKHGCKSTFFCHNSSLVHESLPNATVIHKYADVGIVQPDTTTVDVEKTISLLQQRCTSIAINEWAKTLRNYHLVIADIPPLVFAAAKKANIPVLGIGNFDWVWIYEHFPRLMPWAKTMKRWQEGHHAIQLSPGPPINFSVQKYADWIARESNSLPTSFSSIRVLVGFGGLTKTSIEKLPYIENVRWILTPPIIPLRRKDVQYIQSVPFQSLVNDVDIVFSKAGYGILAESQVMGTPQIWMKRSSFPEASILESFAQSQGDIIIRSQWGTKHWERELMIAIDTLKGVQRQPQKNDSDDISKWIMDTYF